MPERSRRCGATWIAASFIALFVTGIAKAQDGGVSQASASAASTLLASFENPPQEAKPRVWWHWINGNVGQEGARLDLEWMQRVGIGGVHVFSGGLPGPVVVEKRAPFMGEVWKATLRQSIAIAHAAGMEVGIAGAPGWSHTGGPWVLPEDGMKKYVWSETHVTGGRPFDGMLAAPPGVSGPFQHIGRAGNGPALYRDSYVIAYPTPRGESANMRPVLSASDPSADLASIGGEDLSAKISLAVTQDGTAWVEARYRSATPVSAVTLGLPRGAVVELRASNDGRHYRTIARALVESPKQLTHPLVQQTIAFPATKARLFRVVLKPIAQPAPLPMGPGPAPVAPPPPAKVDLSKVAFENGARVNRFEAKAGFQPSLGDDDLVTPAIPASAAIARSAIVDLTHRLRPDGRLDWTPPRGRWTVLRFGWSLTGQTNGPAEPEATGLEVDKLDADAVRRYLSTYLGLYQRATGDALGSQGIQTLLTDSWEAGVQNWTPRLLSEFTKRRGYDPLPFMPVLAGRVVDTADASDRFLWDFRQTLKEMVADNHQRVLADMLHAKGMGYYTEVQGDTPRAIADGMTLKARSDIPTAEYWYRSFAAGPGQLSLKVDLEEAASAAHVYGKQFAAAEALTVAASADPWAFAPAMLKPVADEIFARGINRILLHDSHHQPLPDAKPGLMLMMFGQFFNRNDTWAEDAKPWVDYLARTSWLLQQGRFVADIAYFYGEDRTPTELFRNRLNRDTPQGYRYDYINPEALLTLLTVRNGRIVTPGGMDYSVLFIPPHVERMTLGAISKLRDLVEAGAVLAGAKPKGGLGLSSPDAAVQRVADAIWGADPIDQDGREVGKGRVYATLDQALAGQGIAPDIALSGQFTQSSILSLHRRTADADIYFLSNQTAKQERVEATFRVTGKAPELWRAETGENEPISYRQADQRTTVALTLNPKEAFFIVFARPSKETVWTAPPPIIRPFRTLAGPWVVTFQPGRGAPKSATFNRLSSWTEASDPGIRYFSGSGTYSQSISVAKTAFRKNRRFLLDLGEVRDLAAVTVNGKPLGTVWHAPYRIDVTNALRSGANRIDIRVVNLWPNRLIGDKQPNAKPIAFAPQASYRADSPLLPSGLLGPVILMTNDIASK